MKHISSLMLSLCSVWGFSQTILYQAESTSRTVQDPQAVVMAQGFHAKSDVSNPFLAKIGPSTDNPGGGPTDSNSGANNPSGTSSPAGQSFHDTKGNIDVSAGGQLQYTLPIALPPGVKSVAPQINLVYTSNSGSGIAGYGWNLSGISAISRISKNIERDGITQGIQLDYSDIYSFNGQKLILKSGEYGKDGAEYVTEKYSNIKIKSLGTGPASNPAQFEVTFEDGSQAWYGAYKSGFRDNPDVTTPLEYNIVKWKDVQGNVIRYNYRKQNNVAVLTSITWGGNETLNKADFNEILFTYAARDLTEQSYVAGMAFTQSNLLKEIKVNSNGSQFKRYAINYVKNGTNYQFIDKITEYNSADEAANPVTFTNESDPSATNIFNQNSRYDDIYGGDIITGDFNGDGKLDFLKGNTIMLGRLDGSGNFVNISYTGKVIARGNYPKSNGVLPANDVFFTYEWIFGPTYKLNLRAYSFNGSGVDEIMLKEFDFSQFGLSDLTGYHGTQYGPIGYNLSDLKFLEGDFNGDGISEFIITTLKDVYEEIWGQDWNGYPELQGTANLGSEVFEFYLDPLAGILKKRDNPLTDYTSNSGQYTFISSAYYKPIPLGDFDGDGKTDLFGLRNGTKIYSLNPITKEFDLKAESSAQISVKGVALLGDFNGDGKTDVMSPVAEDSSDWKMFISTGKGIREYYYSNLSLYKPKHQGAPRKNRSTVRTYSISDINKDGKSDFLIFESQVWFRDGVFDWNNPDSSYGFNYLRNDGIDADGKPIFTNAYNISPVELNWDGENINYSMYGEHYIPIVGSSRIAQLNTEFAIIHKTKLITWNLGSKIDKVSRINSITQGGLKTSIEYSNLSDPTVYKSSYTVTPVTYPYINISENTNYSVVSRLTQGERKQDFRYRDLVGHLNGKGMIGFKQSARSTFFATGFESTKVWNGSEIDLFNEGAPYKDWSIRTSDESKVFPSDISLTNTQLLSFKQYEYNVTKILNGAVVTTVADADKPKVVTSINPSVTTTKDFLKDIKIVHKVESYNSDYLPTKSTTTVNNGLAVSTSELEYYPSNLTPGPGYGIGKPKIKTETTKAYGDTKVGKEEYTYENNLLKSTKTWDRDNVGYIQEVYNYDGFGNIIKKTINNSVDAQTKTTLTDYDDKGRFIVKKTDDLGLSNSTTYNNWGQALSQTDPFGNTSLNTYDGWGKLLKSKTNLGGTTTYQYEKDNAFNTIVTQYDPDGNVSKKYTNLLGQVYKSSTKALGQGKFIAKDTKYDVLGRKISESEAYNEGGSAGQWNTIAYDDSVFPAKVTITAFTGKKQETSVTGTTTTERELNGYQRVTSKTADALGNIVSSTDKGGIVQFSYNAAGEQTQAKYGTNIVTIKYDAWGRKSEFNDPSNGIYKYEYDGFGQPKKIVSPKGTKEYTYNNLGQLISQKELSTTDGGQATNKLISFTYDDKGRVISKSGTSNGKAYSSNAAYDPQGRLISTSESSNERYFIQKGIAYNDKGKVISYEKQLYSSGTLTKVQVENVYSAWNGELYQIKDKNSGKVLWELKETNERGQVLKAQLGAAEIRNTYENDGTLSQVAHYSAVKPGILQLAYNFNAIKNELEARTTAGDFNITESFDYDDNNRLINWTNPVTNVKPQTNRNVYDDKGRILENDQVGKIKFDNAAKVYQPTGMTLNAAGTQNYNNDLIQSIVYNENNDPVFIDGMKGDVAFQYGLTNMRQRVTYGGNFNANGDGKFTKFYSEDGSFEVQKDNTTGKEKHVLYIGGSPYESSIIYVKNYEETSGSYKFLHKDYLGSILAISDEAGNKLEQRHYDAWGNLTHLQIGNGPVITDKNTIDNTSLLIDRGYTSHEHFAEVGIIHMNGRLYDPLLRRFLNADENIQDPYNTQNYNKYGYVLNNPLMFNDPTGEIMGWDDVLIAIGVAIFTSFATDYYLNRPVNIGSMFQSVAMSLMSMGISNGIGDVFKVGGEVAKALGKGGTMIARAGAHALAQGALSYVQGGKFLSGMLSGAFASLSLDLLGWAKNGAGEFSVIKSDGFAMLTGAVSGGVGSALTGGNFWAGAAQGLVVTVFNHLAMHDPPAGFNDNYFADGTGEYFKIGEYLYQHRVDGKIVDTKYISGIILKTKFMVAREWFSAISKTGNMITTIGLALTGTVIGAEIGVPLLAIGNGIRLAGDIAYTATYLLEGRYQKFFAQGTEVAASYLASRLTGNALSTASAGQKVLSTDAAQAVAGEINGRMVTDVAAPVIKNEVKGETKYKIRTVY
ncbi:RHS repeat-associated core domain-containing protein [Chryseobacterium sp. PMSZPI]|uniref:RHS repeat-associated core domain-containing protein n=1 Tax=Chryseobacterium sp. PMSZPI TaxID=1033900 RepID=UPI000C31F474|nr:RHS repeat-associated core domain-containing protein [Chryseobacterium sp. PMSZPI]PKF74499.1 type IV secretion protein Rhs [Chryseobacterium sp. PMSZPI]